MVSRQSDPAVDLLLEGPVSAPVLTGAVALTALLLSGVAPTPEWVDRSDCRYRIPLPLVWGGLLLLATASTIFYVDNPLLIARCFG